MTSESNIDDGDPSLDSIIVLLLSSDSSEFFWVIIGGYWKYPTSKSIKYHLFSFKKYQCTTLNTLFLIFF